MRVVAVVAIALLFAAAVPTSVLAVSPLPSSWSRGTVFFYFHKGDFTNPVTLARLANVSKMGGDCVAIQWMWHTENATSNHVYADKYTPSTGELISITQAATAAGLQVIYKPLVVGPGAVQMAELNPSNATAWFASYSEMMVQAATIAQYTGVTALSVGLELIQISTKPSNLPLWVDLINSLRSTFTGQLTYCSVPLGSPSETINIPFWKHLDFVGLDLYVPFVFNRSMDAPLLVTREEMTRAMTFVLEKHVMSWYNSVKSSINNITMFVTESGFPSCNAGLQNPWLPSPDSCEGYRYAPNMTAQAVAVDVYLSVLSSEADAFSGYLYFWDGIPGTHEQPGDPRWGCGWAFNGKPVEEVLRGAFTRG